ncbi:MAG: ABC transporter ATP-binding protein [Hyphomicrobiales bacterium]|nr:MAG: ABC transporter ATP-binding protein [Hyphomicrobiales bacterium]
MILSVTDLHVSYGPVRAVRGLDLSVGEGEIVALIGANGVGKTTTVKAIAGLLPFTGSIRYAGADLTPNRAEANVARGLALVPEGRGILKRMTVEENLRMGFYARAKADIAGELEATYARFPILGERRNGMAYQLSGGEQQMLAIARAVHAKPRLLLLDEPSLGLAPKMTERVFRLIGELRKEGMSVLLVEQRARQTLEIADRAYVLENGRVIAEGRAGDIARDPKLAEAFLGGHAGA